MHRQRKRCAVSVCGKLPGRWSRVGAFEEIALLEVMNEELAGGGATANVRAGRSVVLDGVARQRQLRGIENLAKREKSTVLTVLTSCDDVGVHQAYVTGRQRRIGGWLRACCC